MISTTLSPLVEKLSNFLSAIPITRCWWRWTAGAAAAKPCWRHSWPGSFPRASRCIPMTSIFPQPAVWQTGSRSLAQHGLGASACQVLTPPGPGRQSLPCLLLPGGCLPAGTMLAPSRLVIVEAVTAATHLADCYDLKVFVTCSKEEQARRLLAREGERYSGFTARWIPLEEGYFAKFQIEQTVDFILDTTC